MKNPLFEPIWFTPPDGSDVLWKGGGSPPAPVINPVPDPSVEVRAQAAATPSAYTPYGTRVFAGDPATPGSFHYTDTFAPSQQRQFDVRNNIAEALLGRANNQIPRIPATPFDFRGGTDPETNAAYKAQETLLNKTFDRDRTALEQRLANQGLPMGSEAYAKEIDNFDTSKAAALQQAAANAVGQGYSQALGTRQQNYNELAAMLGGQQLSPVSQAPNANLDVAGAFANQRAAIAQNTAAQNAANQAAYAGRQNQQGGLFQLGAAAFPWILA